LRLVIFLLMIIGTGICIDSVMANEAQVKSNVQYEKILSAYAEGRYEDALVLLDQVTVTSEKDRGLLAYWKGLCLYKINEFEMAIQEIANALELNFSSKDIYYEYGQMLYAIDRFKDAQFAFKKSVQQKYKVAVSLYYIAYIAQQLKDYKQAVSFYNAIEKLSDDEKQEVLQAARLQIAEIYLEQVEKMPDTFRSIEKYVIPQYEKALATNPESKLAIQIKEKITTIQKRYELILFKMRNGVPTADPRHFLKVSLMYGSEDNVNNLSESSKASMQSEDIASSFYNLSFFGRYSFYPNSSYSIAPELRIDYKNYLSDSDSIKVNNLRSTRLGTQINYEHQYKKNPATFYINIDYTLMDSYDTQAEQLQKMGAITSLMLSEGIQLWQGHPSTFRYKFAQMDAVIEASSSITHSLIWEQLISRGDQAFFFYTAYDVVRFAENSTTNNDTFTLRADWIFPTIANFFNPNLFASTRMSHYTEDESRGMTNAMSLGLSLNRPVGKKWYLTFDYSYTNQSGKLETDVYVANRYALNLDYFY
jgi:tetratricopeptide (TPR) repeat protein